MSSERVESAPIGSGRRRSEARAERLAALVVAAVEGAIVLSRVERHPGPGSRSPPSSKA